MSTPKIIMIVDDDPDDIEYFCEALSEINSSIECVGVKGGEEALRLLRNSSQHQLPDLIFLDINMPKMNGKQCLENLKSDINLSSIPVIMYTTSQMQKDIDETRSLGAIHYLTKPEKFVELKKAIEYILELNGKKED